MGKSERRELRKTTRTKNNEQFDVRDYHVEAAVPSKSEKEHADCAILKQISSALGGDLTFSPHICPCLRMVSFKLALILQLPEDLSRRQLMHFQTFLVFLSSPEQCPMVLLR